MIKLKRVYEAPGDDDGYRVLVDRLWPRGVSKERAALDLWFRELAPTTELRKWYGHDPAKWEEFQERYRAEIAANPGALNELAQIAASHPTVTLLYGARDETHNEAVIIKQALDAIKNV